MLTLFMSFPGKSQWKAQSLSPKSIDGGLVVVEGLTVLNQMYILSLKKSPPYSVQI